MKKANNEQPDADGDKKNKNLCPTIATKDICNDACEKHNRKGQNKNAERDQWLFDFDSVLEQFVCGLFPSVIFVWFYVFKGKLNYSFLSVWVIINFIVLRTR